MRMKRRIPTNTQIATMTIRTLSCKRLVTDEPTNKTAVLKQSSVDWRVEGDMAVVPGEPKDLHESCAL